MTGGTLSARTVPILGVANLLGLGVVVGIAAFGVGAVVSGLVGTDDAAL